MQLLIIILTLLSLATLVGLLIKPKYGVFSYLIYMFLAPYLYIAGHIIYARTLALIFLVFFVIKYGSKMKSIKLKVFFPYLLFLIANLLVVFTSTQFSASLNYWFTDLTALFFVILVWASMYTDKSSIELFKWTLFVVFCAITLYGLFLTTMPGVNPYKLIEAPLFGNEFNEAYALGNGGLDTSSNLQLKEGRLFGRISSVFDHPMTYGLNLGFFFIYSFYVLKDKPVIMGVVLFLIFTAAFTSGVRSTIAAMMVTILFMLFMMGKKKYFVYALLVLGVLSIVVPILSPEAWTYFMSMFEGESSSVGGSSINLRIEQLQASFEIAKDHILIGNGYDWEKWYNATYGTHPTALWFESLIYVIIVDGGILGFLIWGAFVVSYFLFVKKYVKEKRLRTCIYSLLVYFLVFCTVTGDFHLRNILVFYTIMMGFSLYNTSILHDKNSVKRVGNGKQYTK